jgi:hypothetical protein
VEALKCQVEGCDREAIMEIRVTLSQANIVFTRVRICEWCYANRIAAHPAKGD